MVSKYDQSTDDTDSLILQQELNLPHLFHFALLANVPSFHQRCSAGCIDMRLGICSIYGGLSTIARGQLDVVRTDVKSALALPRCLIHADAV
jgi:hypothetical protein